MARIHVQLCGQFALELDGRRVESELPGPQGRLLVGYLAVNANRSLTRNEITGASGGDTPPNDPEAVLNPLLSKIRRVLGPERLRGRTQIQFVDRDDVFVDVHYAIDALHRAESWMAVERWAEAAQPGHTPFQIANRPFLLGHEAEWIEEWRRRLEDVRNRGLECYAKGILKTGSPSITGAEMGARQLIELAPFRESGYASLMEALERRGNYAEAVLLYETLRRLLREELGVAPSPDPQQLHVRLLEAASEAS